MNVDGNSQRAPTIDDPLWENLMEVCRVGGKFVGMRTGSGLWVKVGGMTQEAELNDLGGLEGGLVRRVRLVWIGRGCRRGA